MSGRPTGVPFVGQQVVQIVLRICADMLEDIAEIFKRIDPETFACGGDGCQDRGRAAAFVTAEKRPIAPADRDPAQAPFRGVIVNLQVAVAAISYKGIPVGQRV